MLLFKQNMSNVTNILLKVSNLKIKSMMCLKNNPRSIKSKHYKISVVRARCEYVGRAQILISRILQIVVMELLLEVIVSNYVNFCTGSVLYKICRRYKH